jgi:hypothetical protein
LAEKNLRRAAFGLLVLALAVRLVAVTATPAYTPHHDDRDYDRLACFVSDHGFPPDRGPHFPGRGSCAEPGGPGDVTAYRPPLWPMVLGGTYAVAEALDVPRWTAGRVVLAVVGTLIVALSGAVAARLWGPAAGLLTLALAAVFLPLVLDGATLISEPLFVMFELAAVLAVLRYRSGRHSAWAVAAGALVGLAALTRTSGALLAVPLVVAIVWRPGARRWGAAACFVAAAVLVVAPWTIRDAVVMDAFVPVSTETGPTLLGTYNAAARDRPGCTGCWILLSKTPGETELAHRLSRLAEVDRDRESRSLAVRFGRDHPGYVPQVAWENSVRLLELGGEARTRFAARTIDVPGDAAVAGAWELWLVLAVAAVGVVLRRPRPLLALLAFLWVSTVLVQSETPRFRAEIDPLLLMLAGLGLSVLTSADALRRRPRPRRASPVPARDDGR